MRRQRAVRPEAGGLSPGAPAWATIYGDLVTQVLAFFILLYSFSSLNEAKFRETLAALQSSFGLLPQAGGRLLPGQSPGQAPVPATAAQAPTADPALQGLQERLSQELSGMADLSLIGVERRGADLIIRLDASLLFASGSAAVRPEAVPALDALGGALAAIPNPLRIEGHTDSDPMLPNPQYPDNWMLSGARAAGVLRYLPEFHGIEPHRLSIAGYADIRPVASNATAEGKARNRRVEILVLGR